MNEYKVHLSEVWEVMSEQLTAGGEVKFSPKGISMLPLIMEGRDSVVLKKAPDTIKKYDVVLYRRQNGDFVLHRVVAVKADSYTMCGDNQYYREKNVPNDAIMAVMTGLYQGDKYISVTDSEYIRYSKTQVKRQFARYVYYRLKGLIRRILCIK